jgi:hypothetical protein
VLAGSAAGLGAALLTDNSLAASLVVGVVFAGAGLFVLMRYQATVWKRALAAPLFVNDVGIPPFSD